MKVIFLKDVQGTGRKGDMKEVSDGHARNFLIPRGYAVLATADRIKQFETAKRKAEGEEKGATERIESVIRMLKERSIEFAVKTDDAGSVYGSITNEMIQKAIREHGFVTKDRVDAVLEHPIKEIGEHLVPLRFSKGAAGTVKVIVRKQQ